MTLMKSTFSIGITTLLTMLPLGALGQSSFRLQNRSIAYGIDAPVFDGNGVPLTGPNYLAELWGGATMDSLSPLLDIDQGLSRVMAPFIQPGYFFSPSDFLSVVTVPSGGWAWLQLRSWDTRLGATYEEVSALGVGGYGESILFYAEGNHPTLALPEPGAPLIGLQSFSLRPVVPEPSTWALLALGGTALCWVIRRQRQRKP